MSQSLRVIKMEGITSVIGLLGGMKPKQDIMETLMRLCTEIEKHDIHPMIDKTVVTLETAKEAYECMWAQKHFGKVVIKIG
ncbi:hypothetical protein MFIFM68171_09558 [Madurella fahalii]|uniref:Alcohol dehydrogenase n=1 Tax=Madurella fahalii TaxID=1157608 RepID=A0ABQ0GNK1_9PEZI